MPNSTTIHPFVLQGKARCKTCAFFSDYPSEETECRRRAPTRDGFPPTTADVWCGEYWPDRETEIDAGIVTVTPNGTEVYGGAASEPPEDDDEPPGDGEDDD